MKASAITCAVLAGTLGFSTLASAQEWGRHGGDRRDEQRQEQRGDHDRHEHRGDVQQQPRYEHRGYVQQQPRYEHRAYEQRAYVQPRYEQRAYVQGPRSYGYNHPHYYRGGYFPREYIQPSYYVNWQAYPGLYAPPYGYQWVQSGNDFLLVALTTGLIANLLTR